MARTLLFRRAQRWLRMSKRTSSPELRGESGYSRREAIGLAGGLTLGASAFIYLGTKSPPHSNEQPDHDPVDPFRQEGQPQMDRPLPTRLPIAVIGAGTSGLTTAFRLRQAGIPCGIFEAHPNRVGGRMETQSSFNSEGMFCELGGVGFHT
jgi:monoamine oxidase